MNRFFAKIKRAFQLLADFFPSRLPIGDPEFEVWSKYLITQYGFPDNDSGRFALCGMVMSLPPTTFYKSKRYFGLAGLKSLANQTVHAIMLDIQAADKARRVAEAAAKAQEAGIVKQVGATTLSVVDGQQS